MILDASGRLPALDGVVRHRESRVQRHFASPRTSPPPRPTATGHLLFSERRFGAPYGLSQGFFRSEHIQSLPRIRRNPADELRYSRNLDDTATAVASDLLYRYGGGQGMSRSYRPPVTQPSAAPAQPQPQSQAAVCRCESGPGSPTPAALLPPASFAPSFRTVQSLPSTPNAARRTVAAEPNSRSLLYSAPPDHQSTASRPSAATALFSDPPDSRPEQFLLRDVGPGPPRLFPADPLPQSFAPVGVVRSLRHRSSSQPLAKLSSLVIILIALTIVGFIVFSPLLHYSIN